MQHMEIVDENYVSPERARMLAAHAQFVQGGFSTPEREAMRATEQLATSPGSIDWDKMQAEVIAAIAADTPAEEQDAMLEEGLLPMPADLVPLRERKLELDKIKGELEAELKEIKDAFGERLDKDAAQAYVLHGKVHARRSPGTRTTVDGKKLKEEKPAIYKAYLKTTEYVSINIT